MSFSKKLKNLFLILIYLVKHPKRFYNALTARGKKWALRGLILLLIILIAVPTTFWYQAKHAKAGWFDENWAYRIAIPVTNNASAESNVYIATTVDTSDTAKFKNTCGDIRFTNLHGVQLPYYIISGCGTASTIIRVAFDVFPAGAQTIYMYYGNPSAPNGFIAASGSGTVTQANMRLSTVAGTAFTDFSAAGTLTQFSGNQVVISDSAGKKLTGFVKSAGTGETYGTEDASNSSLDNLTGVYDQGPAGGTTLSTETVGCHTGNCLRATIKAGQVFGGWQVISNNAQNGSLYKYSTWAKLDTSNAVDMAVAYSSGTQTQTTGWVYPGSWTQYSLYQTTDGSGQWNKLNWYNHDAAGKSALFDDASTKQVLTPSATGATITSTSGGSTYNWANEESGFNRNDSSGYTYTVLPLQFSTVSGSGVVTQANMKTSVVAGTAFTDFSVANSLTQFSSNQVAISDHTGKKLTGYIKTAGTGETYGSELLANTDFENTDNMWLNNGTMAIVGGGQSGNCVQVTATSDWPQLGNYNATTLSGANYKYSIYLKDGTAADINPAVKSAPDYSSLYDWGRVSPAGWTQYARYVTAINNGIYHETWGSYSGTTFFIDTASLKQVLTPSATGVTITSTSSGSTYNWANEESGFNRNDSLGYTYIVYPLEFSTTASNYTVGSLGAEEKGPGPLAYWKFDEGQGSTAYNSTSQTGINGTLQNSPTWKPESDCVGGKCLQYNGTNQYVSVDDTGTALDFDAAKPYTWSNWINYSGFPAGQTTQCFLSKDGSRVVGKTTGFNLCLRQNGSAADFFVNYGSTDSSNLSLGLLANNWNHIEIEYDGASNWKTYINGAYKGSISFSVSSDTTAKYFIGAACQSTTNGVQSPSLYFQGKIDSVKIFPYQRSTDQIKMDYNSGKSGADTSEGTALSVGESPKWMTDGLVGQWKMDEASGTTVADASGNGNTGTLTNAQETGTAQSGSNTTTILDGANAALSATDNAYNNMILQITNGALNGTQRTISDYTGATKTFSFAALGSDPTGATYIILHQTGGKFGNGLGFDGGDTGESLGDFVSVSDTGDKLDFGTGDFTFSLWAKKTGAKTGPGYISKNTSAGFRFTQSTAGNLRLGLYSGSTWTDYNSSSFVPTTGVWQHLVVTAKRNGQVSFYVDGSSKGASDMSGTASINLGNSHAMRIGDDDWCRSSNCGQYDGSLDDTRIYNRALSPDEVKQLSEWGPGPMGWWKMDENVSGNNQTIKDYSGNGNNGTTNYGANATGMDCTKQGKYGGACQFDGTDDYMSLGSGSSLNVNNTSFSISSWVNLSSQANSHFIYEGLWGVPIVGVDSGQHLFLVMRNATDTNWDTYTESNALATWGTWHYVEASYDGANVKLFVDGKLDGTTARTGIMGGASPSNNTIGGRSSAFVKGSLDDVRVYNYARTPKQVVEDMNAGHPVGGSPIGSQVGYYKFDEGQGGTAYDSSPNHQDLTLFNNTGSNPTWTNSGKFGRALNFTRANKSYVYANDSPTLSLASDLTLSAWIKPTSNVAGAKYDIINKWNSASPSFLIAQYGSELRMYIDGIGNYKTTSGANLQTGQWYYVSGVYNASAQTVTLYVNGVDKGGSVTGTIPASIADGIGKLYIGDAPGAITDYYDGLIDEAKIYGSALTPDQIALDMNQGKEMQLGGQVSTTGATGQAAEYCVPGDATSCAVPVGEWKMDEKVSGDNKTIYDTSGQGRNGTTHYGANTTGMDCTRPGKFGAGCNFDGVDDYAQVPAFTHPNTFTASFWVKFNVLPSNLGHTPFMLAKKHNASPWEVWNFSANTSTNKIVFGAYNAAGSGTWLNSDSAVVAGAWYHVEATMDGSYNMKLYVNGIQQAATGNTGTLNPANAELNFGATTSGQGFIGGTIDQIQLYDYARPPAQVAWDYNRGKPVGWWKMDEGEGDKAYDSSGNSNTGTLTTMDPPNDWVAGKFGKALDFDGSSDRINVGNSLAMNPSYITISAWINAKSFTDYPQIFSKDYPNDQRVWQFRLETSGKVGFIVFWGDNNWQAVTGNTILSTDTWYHVVGTWDGAYVKIYVNGKLDMTPVACANALQPGQTNDAYIGCMQSTNGNPSNFFSGQIDDVRMYNYALTAEQVKQVMNEGSVVRFGE